jgi:alkylation response protein AidB-like acyl-CoA dehydrogenase
LDFKYSEQQDMLRTMAREFLAGECPKSRTRELEKDARGYDPGTWKRMAELGWQGLILPAEYEGSGAGFMDLVVLMEEMGRNILPGPFFATVALAALPIMDFATRKQQAGYLPGIAGGESVWTLAVDEDPADGDYARIHTTAEEKGGFYLLTGEKTLVPYAAAADYMLATARIKRAGTTDKGLTLFIVDMKKPGIKVEPIPTITGENLYQVCFKDVKLEDNDVLGAKGTGEEILERILDKSALLKCAEVCGACQALLEMSVAYAGERRQFGKPIGTFQTIQHRLVDMMIQVEGLQHLVYHAGWMMGAGMDCSEQIAIAKVKANEVYQHAALDCIRVHGAIGFSLDHDAGLYYRRVLASRFFPHDTGHYLEKVAAGIGL